MLPNARKRQRFQRASFWHVSARVGFADPQRQRPAVASLPRLSLKPAGDLKGRSRCWTSLNGGGLSRTAPRPIPLHSTLFLSTAHEHGEPPWSSRSNSRHRTTTRSSSGNSTADVIGPSPRRLAPPNCSPSPQALPCDRVAPS